MPWHATRNAIAAALLTTTLAACATSDGPAPVSQLAPSIQITLPKAPDGVDECLRREFPEIPDRALTKADVMRIIGEAKILDRAKSLCGMRAVEWIRDVETTYSKKNND